MSGLKLPPGSAGWLAALCASRLLGASWLVAYSAVLPLTQAAWGLSSRDAGLIQSAFHLGYLVSLFVVGFLADRYGARRAFIVTGVAAWASPFLFVAFAEGFWSALWLHALTGLCSGGGYTPGLALLNEHVERTRRGRAMSFFIAAASAGYALALGLASAALRLTDWRGALTVVAVAPCLGWLVALYALRGTPNVIHPRPVGESVFAGLPAVLRNRRGRLSIFAYSFHTWELLGLWAWLPAFLTAAFVASGMAAGEAAAAALGFGALTYIANIAGSITGGMMADRWGRTQAILLWSCVSLALSFAMGWLMLVPVALLVALAALHNFSAIADSATHSTVLAESVPLHQVGAAYSIRSLLGFGMGVASPVVFGMALDMAGGGRSSADPFAWGIAWTTLALGGLLGPFATWRLQRIGPLRPAQNPIAGRGS